MSQYVRFAEVYDKMEADRHSIRMTETTFQIMKKFKIQPTEMLDLCCGTGTALRVFADHGLIVSGLDQSKAMLKVAERKLKGRKIRLYCQSLPKFKVPQTVGSSRFKQFDLVTSFYDSLNYMLTSASLKTAYGRVFRHLKKGEWFIFDMNTPAPLKVLWDGQVHADAQDDLAWVWKNEYDKVRKSAACHATFFIKKGRAWERFDETHWERGYSNAEIKKLLREVGFVVKGLYACHTLDEPRKDTYRICVVAQKPE